MSFNYLLLLVDSKGGEDDNASSVTETYLASWDDVKNGYSLSYPSIGCLWKGPNFDDNVNVDLYCTNIQYSRESKKFYSALSGYTQYNGTDCITVEATYTVNYNSQEDKFTKRIAGSGYKTFKISNGGAKWRYTLENSEIPQGEQKSLPVASAQTEYEYKVPISQIDLKTTFLGSIDELAYDQLRNKLNISEFLGRPQGTVLFENYSISPKISGDTTTETDLTLTFKVLPFDWNYEFRNKVQFINSYDNKKGFWQTEYPDRFDYIYNYNEVNQLIEQENQNREEGEEEIPEVSPYDCYLYDTVKSVTTDESGDPVSTTYMSYDEIKEMLAGMPIWSGSILRYRNPAFKDPETTPQEPMYLYERCGMWEQGQEGWDVRYWLREPSKGDYLKNRMYLYEYADFSNMLSGYPIINQYEEPTQTQTHEEEEQGGGSDTPLDNNENSSDNT